MGKQKPVFRKRRTREHVIADLAVNHVERHALLCGHTVERWVFDYGLDLFLVTYDRDGQYENGQVFLQVKATERIKTGDRIRVNGSTGVVEVLV